MKFQLFIIGFGGSFHCPFDLQFMLDDDGKEITSPVFFDAIEDAYEFAKKHIRPFDNSGKTHRYVILPTFSM